MSMLLDRNSKMGSPFLHEFKKQASFFFKEKIKTARLALTDVTPAELLTEEVTNGDFWPPDTRSMGVISRAAFEVDDYWRIVDILHDRLMKFDAKTWRVSYKSMLLLEHLLTHGPLRVAEEFQSDKDVIKTIQGFQFVDEKGFNWGLSVRNLCERILKLLENGIFLKEERSRARKLTREIRGFGSFADRSASDDGSFKGLVLKACARCNSNYIHHHNQEYESLDSNEKFCNKERIQAARSLLDTGPAPEDSAKISRKKDDIEDHPFCDNDHLTGASLLSSKE